MMNTSVRSLLYLFLAILHIFTNSVSKPITPDDLKCICGLKNGSRTVSEVPQGCKTVVLTGTNPDKYMGDIAGIKKIKGDRPIMVVYDAINFNDWLDIFAKKKGNDLIQNIKSMDVDGIIFDNMYDKNITRLNGTFTIELVKWLGELKCLFHNMKFGITLALHDDIIYHNLNITYLNEHIDLYILKSVDYEYNCPYHKNKDEMRPMVKVEDLESNIQKIIKGGMDSRKLIYTIYIKVFSVLYDDDDYSYNYDSFGYSRARLRIKMNLLGVYALDLENDDIYGSCRCEMKGNPSKKFPEFFIIAGASQENKEAVDHYNCVSGSFPHLKGEK